MSVAVPSLFDVPIEAKIRQAHDVLDQAVRQAADERRAIAGIVILFSGGDDSTTLAHMFASRATHVAHANTGIGIEQTRQFVRDTSAAFGLPLLEKRPRDGEGYRELVLGQCVARTGPNRGTVVWRGFPGPAAHWMMYQRLKERSLEQVRNELVSNPRRERVIFIAGRRREESGRRKARSKANAIAPVERKGSIIWVSPLHDWTKLDLNAYRRLHPGMPRNEVAALLHMSGECLCGSFADDGELDEIDFWFPEVTAEIRQLEAEALATGTIPPERCKWGWGLGREQPSRAGPMCSSCDARFQQLPLFDSELALAQSFEYPVHDVRPGPGHVLQRVDVHLRRGDPGVAEHPLDRSGQLLSVVVAVAERPAALAAAEAMRPVLGADYQCAHDGHPMPAGSSPRSFLAISSRHSARRSLKILSASLLSGPITPMRGESSAVASQPPGVGRR